MTLLGQKAWWLPRWLDRVLPDFDVEGKSLRTEEAVASVPALEPGQSL
jgi:RND superfamily putative drug exporter